MTEIKTEYIPGVCNIGAAERRTRRIVGLIGVILTILFIVFSLFFKVDRTYRIVIFFPLFISSMGFLQDRLHFCAEFGVLGVYNLTDKMMGISKVQKEFLKQDRVKALKIIIYSALISCVLTIIFLLF